MTKRAEQGGERSGNSVPQLGERVASEFRDRYEVIQGLLKEKMLQKEDRAFIRETERVVSRLEDEDEEMLDNTQQRLLQDLRRVVDAAVLRLQGGASAEQTEEQLVAQEISALGEGDTAEWFKKAFGNFFKLLKFAEGATGEDARGGFTKKAREQYKVLLDEHEAERANEAISEETQAFLDRCFTLLERSYTALKEAQERRKQERRANPEVIEREIGEQIEACQRDVDILEAQFHESSLATPEEVARLFGILDTTIGNYNDYFQEWKTRVQPIFNAANSAGTAVESRWKILAGKHKKLSTRFAGDRKTETIGLRQKIRSALEEKRRDFLREKWEIEFPVFEYRVAQTIVVIQDARMRNGAARRKAFEQIGEYLNKLQEEWNALRAGGPFVSPEARAKGAYSPVRRYDIQLNTLQREVRDFTRDAEHARGTKLDDAARGWCEAVAGADYLWVDGVNYRSRIAFLRAYGERDDMSDTEIHSVIRAEEREDFEHLAQGKNGKGEVKSQVFLALRTRGKRRHERSQAEETRERRRGLWHEKLALFRVEAKIAEREALHGAWWKEGVPERRRQKLLRLEVPIEQEVLARSLTDGEAFQRAQSHVQGLYARVTELEDAMLREEPVIGRLESAEDIEILFNRYFRAMRKERSAWDRALDVPELQHHPLPKRKTILQETYREFYREGDRAIDGLPDHVVEWVLARIRRDVSEDYTRWVLRQNLELVAKIDNLPRRFWDLADFSKETGANEEVAGDDALVVLQRRSVEEDEEGGSGDITGLERGVAAAGLESGVGDDQTEEVPMPAMTRVPLVEREPVASEREATLAASGSAVVKKLATS